MSGAHLATPRAILCAAAILAMASCRSPRPVALSPMASGPTALAGEEYCWWSVWRTPLPPDTVAARFADAFHGIGLPLEAPGAPAWSSRGDTAWAQSGRDTLGGRWGTNRYAARVVAYRRGDTTLFRHFVAVDTMIGGNHGASAIALCGALGQMSAVHGVAPGAPDGEERHPVWRSTHEANP